MLSFTEFTPYQYLPFFAKLAIERLNADPDLRNVEKLDELMQAYAGQYGLQLDALTRTSAHRICAHRFYDFTQTIQQEG